MTATRIGRAATIAALATAWVAAAALLWRTRVPAGLELPELDPRAYFTAEHLRRSERYERFLRLDSLVATVAQLAAALALAVRAPQFAGRLRGGRVARGVQLALATLALLWLVRLPFGLAALWWRRRHGIAQEDYVDWLVRPWPSLVGQVMLACGAVALLMVLAARCGRRWWVGGAATVGALAAAYVVAQPLLLAPRYAPLRDPALAADVRSLAREMGVGDVEVRRNRARDRTRAVNAEVVGIGPTRRIALWDTLLDGRFHRAEVRAIAAHELAHVTERHVWKGLGWFLLAVAPAVFLVDRAARLRGGLARPEAVPAAIAAALVLQLVGTPAATAVSRRYEAEADWVAVEATRDPAAMRGLLRRLATTNLADPDPPAWWAVTFRTHPALIDRIAMAEAWAVRAGKPLTAR